MEVEVCGRIGGLFSNGPRTMNVSHAVAVSKGEIYSSQR